MARKASKGTCRLCNAVLTGTGMSKHLQSCLPKHVEGLQESKGSKRGSFFHIMVQGAHAPEYWLHLKVSSEAKLKVLDTFLREIWLECCGHLSAFRHFNRELRMQRKLFDIQPLACNSSMNMILEIQPYCPLRSWDITKA
jgi:hypothetical protein